MRSINLQVLTNQTRSMYSGVVIYGIGDDEHQKLPSDHNEDDTPGSNAAQGDSDSNPEHRAIDVMIGPAFSKAQADAYVQKLVTRPANQRRLAYVIWNRYIWRRNGGWVRENYAGSDPHTNHPHVSGLATDDENGASWDLADTSADAPTTSRRPNEMIVIKNKDTGAHWAMLGASPGTPLNCKETTEGEVALQMLGQCGGKDFIHLHQSGYDRWKADALEPLTVVTPDPDS